MKSLCMVLALFLNLAYADTLPSAAVDGLSRLDGSKVESTQDRLLLYFWASWCADCKDKLRKDLPQMALPQGAQLLTVNTDKDLDRANHFIKAEALSLPVVRESTKDLVKQLKVFSVPHWAVLQRQASGWNVVASQAGGDLEKMKAALAGGEVH